MSVMLTRVLLKVARMLAIPLRMFLAPLALMIFLPAISSASNSAAVGAATAGAPAAGAPSAVFGGSATGASPSVTAGAVFFGALGPGVAPLGAVFSPDSAFGSFFGAGFFFSSAMDTLMVEIWKVRN